MVEVQVDGLGQTEVFEVGEGDLAADDAIFSTAGVDLAALVWGDDAGDRLQDFLGEERGLLCELVDVGALGVIVLVEVEGEVEALRADDAAPLPHEGDVPVLEIAVEVAAAVVEAHVVGQSPRVEAGEDEEVEFG